MLPRWAYHFTDVSVDQNTGEMEAYGYVPFGGSSTLTNEVGYVFTAPEDGSFKVAIVGI